MKSIIIVAIAAFVALTEAKTIKSSLAQALPAANFEGVNNLNGFKLGEAASMESLVSNVNKGLGQLARK